MKDANVWPAYSAKELLTKTQGLLEAQLLYAGIRLDIFSYLSQNTTSKTLAEITGYNQKNLELFLNALTAAHYIRKEQGAFVNLPQTEYYLNKSSEYYLGDYILYWYENTKLDDLEMRVRQGSDQNKKYDKNGSDSYDFKQMARVSRNEMYTGRVQAFIQAMKTIFSENEKIRAIDLGGGCGIMSIELARNFKNAIVTVMDQPEVLETTRKTIEEYGVGQRVRTVKGNFIIDPLGNNYDLVIASGIFDFVGDVWLMAEKIYASLADGGVLYMDTHKVNDDKTSPKQCVLSWLSSHLEGIDILRTNSDIVGSVKGAGFIQCESAGEHAYSGYIFRKEK